VLIVYLHDRIDGCVELRTSVQEGRFDDEEIFDRLSALFGDEFTCGRSRTSCCNEVINNYDVLARLDTSGLHLKYILAILLLVFSGDAFSREFPYLPDGDEGGLQPRGDDRAE